MGSIGRGRTSRLPKRHQPREIYLCLPPTSLAAMLYAPRHGLFRYVALKTSTRKQRKNAAMLRSGFIVLADLGTAYLKPIFEATPSELLHLRRVTCKRSYGAPRKGKRFATAFRSRVCELPAVLVIVCTACKNRFPLVESSRSVVCQDREGRTSASRRVAGIRRRCDGLGSWRRCWGAVYGDV